jgi:uncharacterized cupredoxin-like copper-binding protein
VTDRRSAGVWRVGALASAGAMLAAGCSAGAAPLPTRPLDVEVRLRYSKFEPASLVVPAGRPVRFVLRNDDFLDHEFMVGDDAMQKAHETGTEPRHDARPTEVDVPGGETVTTTITFEPAGRLTYACHVPGHFRYGMVGILTVTG